MNDLNFKRTYPRLRWIDITLTLLTIILAVLVKLRGYVAELVGSVSSNSRGGDIDLPFYLSMNAGEYPVRKTKRDRE